MRKVMLGTALMAAVALSAPSVASATHTGGGCEHTVTSHAHATVPHKNQGTHQAHSSIPYCPPRDAPRHKDESTGGH